MDKQAIAAQIKSVAVNYEAMYDALDKKKAYEFGTDQHSRFSYEQAMHEEMLRDSLEALAGMGIEVDLRF